jgi:hypothetical protein
MGAPVFSLADIIPPWFSILVYHLGQGWANFFVGGTNEKSKMSGGPT